ncbi:hypothetical protein GLYMA_14G040850v4 [Glycine max]|nr:hypothetical protein GYH30_038980 [Glycine max]KRH14674.2 hypothetical protein GLYMA_14G040850v4 [Glycine max]
MKIILILITQLEKAVGTCVNCKPGSQTSRNYILA